MNEIAGATAGTGVVLLVIAFIMAMAWTWATRARTERIAASIGWVACALGAVAIMAAIWINVLT